MKVHFDEQSDAIYFRLDDSAIVESEEVKPGFILDYNEKNEIVGFEILHVIMVTDTTGITCNRLLAGA